jgi:DNA replication protein DnaC
MKKVLAGWSKICPGCNIGRKYPDSFIKEQSHDLLEILEDRHGLRSTLVTSQLPVEHRHEIIGNPTLADAILDRLIHNAYRINLKGESRRKKKTNLTQCK